MANNDEKDNEARIEGNQTVSEQLNSEIEKLKQSKSRSKAGFTRARHNLLQLLEEDLPSRREIQETRDHLNAWLDKVMEKLSVLSDKYAEKHDFVSVTKICN